MRYQLVVSQLHEGNNKFLVEIFVRKCNITVSALYVQFIIQICGIDKTIETCTTLLTFFKFYFLLMSIKIMHFYYLTLHIYVK